MLLLFDNWEGPHHQHDNKNNKIIEYYFRRYPSVFCFFLSFARCPFLHRLESIIFKFMLTIRSRWMTTDESLWIKLPISKHLNSIQMNDDSLWYIYSELEFGMFDSIILFVRFALCVCVCVSENLLKSIYVQCWWCRVRVCKWRSMLRFSIFFFFFNWQMVY